MIICTWQPCGSDRREVIKLREEDWEKIKAFQEWWKENGEEMLNKYYGILKVEKNGDLVIKDIDEYLEKLEETWVECEDDEEITSIPGWQNTPDFEKEAKKQMAKQKEKIKKFKPTVKVVRPKKEKVTKDKSTIPTKKKKRTTFREDVVKAVMKILEDTEKEIDDDNNKNGDGEED